ncbi:sensor histidine kinase [Yeguia hominis]|uniref:Sensor histidine kinase n=1 Tax=Yeguia hominis TaxID=2763662 RepID=A0A926D828_9FIRM|nr:sensor histidine kinase [Yeguia hominis]MBC8533052.1 sensor histidine kinase [Yeguia hominis]
MKNGIKSKIIKKVTTVVVVSAIVSGIVLGIFFISEIQNQVYGRDVGSVSQISEQLNTIASDISAYARNIISDPTVQDPAMRELQAHNYSENYNYALRLKDYQNLRSYIQSIVVVTKDGNSYWSLPPYYNDHVFDAYMQMDWYQKIKDQSGVFGEPFEIQASSRRGTETVFSYVMDFRSRNDPQEFIGKIFLNIKLSDIQQILAQQSTNYDAFLCCTADGNRVFASDDLPDGMTEILADPEKGNESNHFVVNSDNLFGWTMVSYISSFTILEKLNFWLYAFVIVALTTSVCLVARLFMRHLIKNLVDPISELTDAIHRVSGGELDTRISICTGDEIERMSVDFNKMVSNLCEYIARSIEDEKIKKRLEFELLISQINPHFIYNTLNTIIYRARKSGDADIVEITVALIQILQGSIHISSNDTLIPLDKELQSVRDYLTIQRYRFGDAFSVSYEIGEHLETVLVPQKSVQILVENALVHGVLETERDGVIRISAQYREGMLVLCVEDNGAGMSEERIREVLTSAPTSQDPNCSVGIFNIKERVRYIYNIENALKIESEMGKYTKVTLEIPILYQNREKGNKKEELLH